MTIKIHFLIYRNKDFHEVTLEKNGEVLLRFAAAYGFRNIQNMILKLKKGKFPYHFVEVLACPRGKRCGRPINSLSTVTMQGRLLSHAWHAVLSHEDSLPSTVMRELDSCILRHSLVSAIWEPHCTNGNQHPRSLMWSWYVGPTGRSWPCAQQQEKTDAAFALRVPLAAKGN